MIQLLLSVFYQEEHLHLLNLRQLIFTLSITSTCHLASSRSPQVTAMTHPSAPVLPDL